MLDNQFYFNVKDDKVKVSFKRGVNLPEFLQVVFTGTLNAMLQIVNTQRPEDQLKTKEEIYDMFNAGASRTLEYFAPEIEMRPNLTAQAILEAEDKIMKRNAKSKRVR